MIKTLAKSIREYKIPSILTPVLVMLEVLFEVIIPFIMAKLVDEGISAGNMSVILKLGTFLLLSAFLALVSGALAGKTAAHASAGFAKNLRQDMFYNVQKFSFSNIDKFSTSSIITRLTTDVMNVQNSYQMLIRGAVRSPIMLAFTLFAAFRINKELSMIFLGAIPVLGIGLFLIIKNAHPIFRKVFKTYDKLNNVVQENLRGIRVVKAFVREDYEIKKFSDISNEIYERFTKAEKILVFNMPLIQFCMFGSMLLLSWFGAKAIVASGNNPALGLTTGQLMSLMTYVMQILISLMMLSMIFVMITISRASAERIVELINEETDLKNCENPVFEVADGSIEFKNVSFCYSDKADKMILENINLKIESGETVGIIGGTGSAKTTLIQLIPRLYDVSKGVVKVGGRDVREYDLKTLRDQVAVVLQKNVLFSGTIKENLKWGDENARDEEIKKAAQIAQADGFINEFPDKYDTYIEQGGTNVSGGQKQRLTIARALLKKPKIIILDDSTSAVDTKTEALIKRGFTEELSGTTKIIIAQRVSSVQDADKIVVMDNGKITEIGTHDELMEKSRIYREVYESQVKGGVMANV
ncbi:MAG TPA: ABC transporter ATP-binding protein [Ruminiclostridium sp.]|jgi:ATP-binding cassette subfamily B protein|uniref:ABC transporter n=1 Tax=Acetivibrio saccincola TaxID=1677857 RepID=A0A2S8R999_9FIRM|nr:ABC transporter ATP-binding protein [Acetivibrio saccincola]NLW25877.1 ABC transporter ATP-binding protein [Acetivibrio saccincola]PQQ66371.1 ABC transporter [Acetivibrio saccincola]HAA43757.1 ABC transporter ATP-binding protein [Ruminiclostridium sp.]